MNLVLIVVWKLPAGQDYINMCSEQYYWYNKGYIDNDVWNCWKKGMNYWYINSKIIKKIVDNETNENYYNANFLEQFK